MKLFEGVPLQDRLNEYLRRGKLEMLQSTQPFAAARDAGSDPRVRDLPDRRNRGRLAAVIRPPSRPPAPIT